MEQGIEPWGVNVPYIYLATIMFLLGGLSLFFSPSLHPYFMTIGVYALFFGMIQRLFFPAKKYLVTQILSLIFLAIPLSHYFQFLSSLILSVTEVWALYDVKRYGSKFPVNLLVLSSPFLSVILWFFFINYWSLTIPILVYILGVNIGIFTATLGAKPFFGIYQLPILVFSLLTLFLPLFLPITLSIYFLFLFRKRIKGRFSYTSLSVILVSTASSYLSIVLGDQIHAFYLDIMYPFFFSCITYSTARYNHDKVVYTIPFLFFAYILRFVSIEFSSIFLPISYLLFLFLIKDTLGITGLKIGMSSKYLRKNEF